MYKKPNVYTWIWYIFALSIPLFIYVIDLMDFIGLIDQSSWLHQYSLLKGLDFLVLTTGAAVGWTFVKKFSKEYNVKPPKKVEDEVALTVMLCSIIGMVGSVIWVVLWILTGFSRTPSLIMITVMLLTWIAAMYKIFFGYRQEFLKVQNNVQNYVYKLMQDQIKPGPIELYRAPEQLPLVILKKSILSTEDKVVISHGWYVVAVKQGDRLKIVEVQSADETVGDIVPIHNYNNDKYAAFNLPPYEGMSKELGPWLYFHS
jgi:hypothetical protein